MKKEVIFRIIEAILVLTILTFFYLKNIESVEFHIDESHWIGTSYMFEAYFKGEFGSDAWQDSQPTVTNPPIPRYVIGISRFIGGYRIPDLNRRWDYDHNVNFNLRMGAMPSDGLLWWSRLPMAILAVLSIWIGFLFVKKIGGWIAAYTWVVFGIANPFFLLQTRRAMAESSILFFVMLAAFFCYRAIQNLDHETIALRWKPCLYLALSGVCIGLAGESKINGLSVLAGVILSIVILVWKKPEPQGRKIGAILFAGALVTLATLVTFLGTYPYLWPDLVGRSARVFENRLEEMQYQSLKHAPDAINTLEQRLTIIPMRIFEDYAVFDFNGAVALNVVLTMLGAGIALVRLRDWLKAGKESSAAMVLLAIAVTASAPSFFTLLDWDRYYLFPVFFSSMAIAIGIGWLIQKLYHRLRLINFVYKGG